MIFSYSVVSSFGGTADYLERLRGIPLTVVSPMCLVGKNYVLILASLVTVNAKCHCHTDLCVFITNRGVIFSSRIWNALPDEAMTLSQQHLCWQLSI